jgi:serine/threonine protein kinase
MAKVVVRCANPDCPAEYPVDESLLGRRATCKKCDTKFVLARTTEDASGAGPVLSDWTDGQTILNEFVVERKLGQGGMGSVYQVVSRSSGHRFAVKKSLFTSETGRRNFLRELVTWIDLPDHPFLTACRFFRTVGEEVVIFAEYIEGGTLAESIRDGKLTRLDQMLDVAIQFAWGLHTAHECGVIHRDVKPGNVLLTAEGQVKITDFGLASAREVSGETATLNDQSILVSCGGMTPAYASPEQSGRSPLSRKTDIWSFAVSVLDLFVGKVPSCRFGMVAPQVLRVYQTSGPVNESIPAMPEPLVGILNRCLLPDPAGRWSNLGEVTKALCALYEQITGQPCPRDLPPAPSRQGLIVHDRRTISGGQWADPQKWLRKALLAAGRDPAEAETLVPPRAYSRQARATADLTVYDEAWNIYKGLVAAGRTELEREVAELAVYKAFVHEATRDVAGALVMYDQAIAICERLVNQEGRHELAGDLARNYMNKAIAVRALGDNREAVRLYDQAIAIRERLVNQEGRRELANDLARNYVNKANAVSDLGDNREAV